VAWPASVGLGSSRVIWRSGATGQATTTACCEAHSAAAARVETPRLA